MGRDRSRRDGRFVAVLVWVSTMMGGHQRFVCSGGSTTFDVSQLSGSRVFDTGVDAHVCHVVHDVECRHPPW